MSDRTFSADRPLPEGVRDLLFADAAAIRGMAASLASHLARLGLPRDHPAHLRVCRHAGNRRRRGDRCRDVPLLRPPGPHPGPAPRHDHPHGAGGWHPPVRPADAAAPGYVGSVFRYEPPRAGRQHEFTQAGVELIGAPGAAADAEVDCPGRGCAARGRSARIPHHRRPRRLLPRAAGRAGPARTAGGPAAERRGSQGRGRTGRCCLAEAVACRPSPATPC